MKIAVIGAKGRMGQAVSAAIDAAEDMELVAGLDAGDDLEAVLGATGATHAVDFTNPGATLNNVITSLRAGVHVVVGTSGWTEEGYRQVRETAVATGKNAVIAPNFAISAVLAMKFAALAAPYFESVEVIEMHHPDKVDAPSGTATATAKGIAAARAAAGIPMAPDNTQFDELGTRGGKIAGVPVHAVRLRGLYAHQEALLGNPGEQLVVRTDCFDRAAFMPGVLLALRQVGAHPGLTIGLESLLGLESNQ
ncbi:4-hydroxy-tetrahydrodipicolinate reductase [Mobiluncus mulieris]|uniref:4-hydroxy-tetrahydrodipicolinate reductase n=1 Tax=Mobiluncus mulieris TaxID=2052 RepID=UPI00146FF523|nr:4-hydroxy-tetrahydrodipicolinate reductase [Mobiluncus mulieris]NMW59574.1 4-hydroxy-tetrahydrodipicolinate reductase [Mobiluncus mulieris]